MEVEYGGIKATGGKLFVIISLLGTVGAGLCCGRGHWPRSKGCDQMGCFRPQTAADSRRESTNRRNHHLDGPGTDEQQRARI